MDQELKQYLDENFRQVRDEIAAAETRSSERVERVETALLTEFHKWAPPVERKVRGLVNMVGALNLELGSLKERVDELEKRKPS